MKGQVADTANVVGIGIERPLCQSNRRRRSLRKLVGPILDSGIQLRRGHDFIHKAHLTRLFGGVAVVNEPDLARLLVADVARQEGSTPASIDRADLRSDLTKLSSVGSNGKIAKGGKHVSSADSKSIDARNDGLGNVADKALQFVNWQSDDAAAVILSFVRGLVPASAESLVARTCQHNARNVSSIVLTGAGDKAFCTGGGQCAHGGQY